MRKLLLAVLALVVTLPVYAADRAFLTVSEVMEIKAKPEEVWNAVKAFDGIKAWIPVVVNCKLEEGSNGKVGAVRSLELNNGWVVYEELVAYREEDKIFSYALYDGPFPADDYVATTAVRANADGTGSLVTWNSTFRRRSHSATPPKGESDAELIKALSDIYKQSLGNLKKMVEKK